MEESWNVAWATSIPATRRWASNNSSNPDYSLTTTRALEAYVKGAEAGAKNRILEARLQERQKAWAARKKDEAAAEKTRVGTGGLITAGNAKAMNEELKEMAAERKKVSSTILEKKRLAHKKGKLPL